MAYSNSLQRYPSYAATLHRAESYANGPVIIYGLTAREAVTMRTQFYGYRKLYSEQMGTGLNISPTVLEAIRFADSLTVRIRDIEPDEMKFRHKNRQGNEHCKVLTICPQEMLSDDLNDVVNETIGLTAPSPAAQVQLESSSAVARFMARHVDEENS